MYQGMDPIVVTARGVWQGKRVSYEHTFRQSVPNGVRKGHDIQLLTGCDNKS
ncbi:SSI family serine proteinase inhibitor [Nocardia cyriacigeorgica]|uniref:SSI family serine proteinase inhibitor n=1 Tax=Nocardia cyriacigeorgica TaxID=135487 RepID=UPI003CC7CDDB